MTYKHKTTKSQTMQSNIIIKNPKYLEDRDYMTQ